MRRKSRECAFKIIFAGQFHTDVGESFRRGFYKAFGLNEEERAYAETLLSLVEEHREELLSALDSLAIGFSAERLFPADKSLMLMAMAEIRYGKDVPPAVAIDEAVGLARQYSTEKSAGFVNGILAAFLAEDKKQ